MKKQYIICADDFGLSRSVNKAIIDVFKIGNLTHTSLMVNMPASEEAFRLSKDNQKLNVGLHFNITEGKSILGKSSLTDTSGIFLSRKELIYKNLKGKLNKEDIANEFNVQLNEFKKFNVKLNTVDSHQHIHTIPKIFNSIYTILVKNNLSIRLCFSDHIFTLNNLNHFFLNLILFYKRNNSVFRNHILTSVHHHSKNFNEQEYKDIVKKNLKLNKTMELMIHPYIDDDDLKALYKEKYVDKMNFFKTCFKEYEILSKKPIFNNL